jgi:predicted RNase H-like HicB family nuclease
MKNTSRLRDYPFTVRPLAKEEGGGYLIEFPDLRGCISDGETLEDAIYNGQDALNGYLLSLREFDMPAPRPGFDPEEMHKPILKPVRTMSRAGVGRPRPPSRRF